MNYETLVNTPLNINFNQLLNDRSWVIDGTTATHYPCNQDSKLKLLNYVIEPNTTYTVSFNILEASNSPLLKLGFNTVQYTYSTPQEVTVDILTSNSNRKITFWGNGYLVISNFNIKRKDETVALNTKPTITWDEKNNKWASFRSYKPEKGFSMFNNMFTYKDGNLWVHKESTLRNNFHGEQFNSFINFPISSAMVKNYQSVAIHTNQLMVTSLDGIKTELGHVSDLIEADFDTSEGIHYANFLRDKLTDIINGDRLKGRYITLELTAKDGSKKIQLFKVEVKSTVSENQTYSRRIKDLVEPPATVYQSIVKSGTTTKNNCGQGTGGAATLTTTIGQFTSTISQGDADQKAQDYININLQSYVNANATCIYLSSSKSKILARNNCSAGYVGTTVTLSTTQGQFISTISQEDANSKAQNFLDLNTQTYANNNGTCILATTYQSVIKSGSATRNNCSGSDVGTSVTLSTTTGQFTSTISQADADNKAQDWVDNNKQANANTNGTCTPVATYGNTYQFKDYTRNNCTGGQLGTSYREFRNANTFYASSVDIANSQAMSSIEGSGQSNANASGNCVSPSYFNFNVQMKPDYIDTMVNPSDSRGLNFEFRNGSGYSNIISSKLVSTEINNNNVQHNFSVAFAGTSVDLGAIKVYLELKSSIPATTFAHYIYFNGTLVGAPSKSLPAKSSGYKYDITLGISGSVNLTNGSTLYLVMGTP